MIKAIGIEKTIQTSESLLTILSGVSLNVNEGEAVALLGASGSGKTTLLSLLAGLDLPTRGEVFLAGRPLHQMTEDERARARLGNVGFIFQNFELLPHLTALENVMLPLELCRRLTPAIEARALLNTVGLSGRENHFPHQLSGGEQQRVAIARAYVTSPQILFADEPTGCLDTQTGEKIIDLLFGLRSQLRTTLIFVTHDASLAKRCDRQFLLAEGKCQCIS